MLYVCFRIIALFEVGCRRKNRDRDPASIIFEDISRFLAFVILEDIRSLRI